jgi:hypothetical protein
MAGRAAGGEVGDPPGSGGIGSIGRCAGALRHPAGAGIVGAEEDRTGHVLDHSDEALLDAVGRPEVVHVVRFHVGDDESLEANVLESPERLVDLEDEEVVVAEMGVGPEPGQLATDDEGRVDSRCPQRPDHHRRGRGLAVGAGRTDGGKLGAERSQQVGTPPHCHAGSSSGAQLRIGIGNGRRRHH